MFRCTIRRRVTKYVYRAWTPWQRSGSTSRGCARASAQATQGGVQRRHALCLAVEIRVLSRCVRCGYGKRNDARRQQRRGGLVRQAGLRPRRRRRGMSSLPKHERQAGAAWRGEKALGLRQGQRRRHQHQRVERPRRSRGRPPHLRDGFQMYRRVRPERAPSTRDRTHRPTTA